MIQSTAIQSKLYIFLPQSEKKAAKNRKVFYCNDIVVKEYKAKCYDGIGRNTILYPK